MPATFGTVIKPTRKLVEYLATHSSNNLAKSLIAVSTPQHASQLKTLHEAFPKLQVVGFSTDTVPLGCQRDGFSWMVMETPLKVVERQPLVEEKHRNWTDSTAAVRITSSLPTGLPPNKQFSPLNFAIPAANTLFSTGQKAEIYAENGEPLHALHVDLQGLRTQPLPPLRPVEALSDWQTVTACSDNMLKTLDDHRAASVLEQSAPLQTAVDPQVFAEVQSSGEFVKVIAGGGGLWSPRSSMLVLEPPFKLVRGDKLRFWLQNPAVWANGDYESQLYSTKEDSIVAEVASVPETLAERPVLEFKPNHHISVFGFGSEKGFMVGDHKHAVVGESLCYRYI